MLFGGCVSPLQHFAIPSSSRAQICDLPASIAVKVPLGICGSLCDLLPQHLIVPASVIPHEKSSPAVICWNFTPSGACNWFLSFLPQHTAVPSSCSPHA